MVPGVALYTLYTYPWEAALFFSLLLVATGICVLLHELAHLGVARLFSIGTRDMTLYPLWGVAQLMHRSERPWQENYIALAGPSTHILLAGLLALGLKLAGHDLSFHAEDEDFDGSLFVVHLFWVNILLALFNLLPFLPLDGGTIFRASLAMTTGRLRATEVAVLLSTVGTLLFVALAALWLQSPLLASVAVLLYFAAQEEVRTTRFFASLIQDSASNDTPPPLYSPADQLLHDECQPTEPNFTGFTWNPKLRLWIEWRNGEAQRANALVGE
jgi:Zn-dependent protease